MRVPTPSAYGSSRTTGGHIRGNAQGNTANIADLEDEPSIVNHPKKVEFVFLYHSTTCILQHLDQMEETNSFFKVTTPSISFTSILKLIFQGYWSSYIPYSYSQTLGAKISQYQMYVLYNYIYFNFSLNLYSRRMHSYLGC